MLAHLPRAPQGRAAPNRPGAPRAGGRIAYEERGMTRSVDSGVIFFARLALAALFLFHERLPGTTQAVRHHGFVRGCRAWLVAKIGALLLLPAK